MPVTVAKDSSAAAAPGRAVRIARAGLTASLFGAALYLGAITVDTAVGLLSGGDRPLGGQSLELPAQVPPEQLALPPGYERAGWMGVTATIQDPDGAALAAAWAVQAGPAALGVAVLWLLRRVVDTVRAGAPFEVTNLARLRTIGSLLLLGAPLLELGSAAVRSATLGWLPAATFGDVAAAGPRLPLAALLAGLGVHVLAAVFAEGLRLREDVEATI